MMVSRLKLKIAIPNRNKNAENPPAMGPVGVSRRRRALSAIVLFAMIPTTVSVGGFPEAIERGGRFCGRGYGDGYHACYSSGMRPLANLPPRSFAARVGTMDEKIQGCETCRPRPLPGVEPIGYRKPETFYHRFDRYAEAVSHQQAMSVQRPSQPLMDPEENLARGYSMLDPDGNVRERSGYGRPRIGSPYAGVNADGDSVLEKTGPQISDEEMEEFREFKETKRLRDKFDQYLIDPRDTEPNQIIGGPPVGTEQRRRIDEAKVEALQEKLRRELAEEAAAKKAAEKDVERFNEDRLMSPSDMKMGGNRRAPSALNLKEDLPMPMDELLPPFPDEDLTPPRSRQLPTPQRAFPEPDRTRPGLERIPTPEPISPGLREQLDDFNSAKPESLPQTPIEFNAPMQTSVDSKPAARVASIPEAWRFIKQPN